MAHNTHALHLDPTEAITDALNASRGALGAVKDIADRIRALKHIGDDRAAALHGRLELALVDVCEHTRRLIINPRKPSNRVAHDQAVKTLLEVTEVCLDHLEMRGV